MHKDTHARTYDKKEHALGRTRDREKDTTLHPKLFRNRSKIDAGRGHAEMEAKSERGYTLKKQPFVIKAPWKIKANIDAGNVMEINEISMRK